VLLSAVLVVEDDEPTRKFFLQTLRAAGFQVSAVDDGLKALEAIELGKRPDAIVLDLGLPRLGGKDLYAELNAQADTKGIPIIVVTGQELPAEDRATYPYFLKKPVRPEALVFAVDNALRRHAARA
jgi:DNA-binding response OmpR family regulator